MCTECDREYHDPLDRRFHAQPNACPRCGPQLQLWDENGAILSEGDDALLLSADAIRAGKIVALKGIGGFQLIVDARNERTVSRLRERKHREEKPFALMCSSLKTVCEIAKYQNWKNDCSFHQSRQLFCSPQSAITARRSANRTARPATSSDKSEIAQSVAPRNPNLGVMLPYTPLHHLLMRELDFPVVATSGNLSDEPICIDEQEALERLRGIADIFLVHNRPIVRHVDDSITRIMCGRELVLRRARGFAPLPIAVKSGKPNPRSTILSVGAHLKNTVALKIENNVFISQHIGDLETEASFWCVSACCRRSSATLRRQDRLRRLRHASGVSLHQIRI